MNIPSLVLKMPAVHQELVLDEVMPRINGTLFNRFGVIAPTIQVAASDAASELPVLMLDDERIGTIDGSSMADSIASLLLEHPERLVTDVLASFYLSREQTRSPRLVAAVRILVPIADLVGMLKSRVQAGKSIRNFSGVLDDLLCARIAN